MLELVGLLTAFLVPLGLGTLLVHLVIHFFPELRPNRYVTGLWYALANWITVALFLVFLFPELSITLAEIGFKSTISLIDAGLALLFTFASLVWFGLISRLRILQSKSPDLKIRNWIHAILLVFYAPITAAFCEEFFYRGFAITVLNRELGNIWIAGIISSVIFALMHIPRHGREGFVSIGLTGLLLTIVFILTGSIYPGILMHSIVDFVGFVIIPFVRSKGQKV